MLSDEIGAQTTPCGYWIPACAGTTIGEWRVVSGAATPRGGRRASVCFLAARMRPSCARILRFSTGGRGEYRVPTSCGDPYTALERNRHGRGCPGPSTL